MVRLRQKPTTRQAVIAELARRLSTKNKMTRTGLMKLMYFLQTLKEVELGYSFRLYTYGPYDGQVLEDLRVAEALSAVRSRPFRWQGGSGSVIEDAENADTIIKRAANDLTAIEDAIKWVVDEFGNRTASELELASTIIFVDRACEDDNETISLSEMASRVHEIKPHHEIHKIKAEIQSLNEKDLLISLN